MKTYPCPNNDGIRGCSVHQTYGLHDLLPPRRFVLKRTVDVSGVSGVGIVAEAVLLNSGQMIVSWLIAPHSLSLHASMKAAQEVHGHNGATEFVEVE